MIRRSLGSGAHLFVLGIYNKLVKHHGSTVGRPPDGDLAGNLLLSHSTLREPGKERESPLWAQTEQLLS
jgi:hypothetical protein